LADAARGRDGARSGTARDQGAGSERDRGHSEIAITERPVRAELRRGLIIIDRRVPSLPPQFISVLDAGPASYS
jgi:hypothetical protein